MITPQEAHKALNTLIEYGVERGMEWFTHPYNISHWDLVNRLKPYLEVLKNELLEIEWKNDLYTTLKFAPDWNNHWKCQKCGNMQGYASECRECWRRSITLANGKNDYSLIK